MPRLPKPPRECNTDQQTYGSYDDHGSGPRRFDEAKNNEEKAHRRDVHGEGQNSSKTPATLRLHGIWIHVRLPYYG